MEEMDRRKKCYVAIRVLQRHGFEIIGETETTLCLAYGKVVYLVDLESATFCSYLSSHITGDDEAYIRRKIKETEAEIWGEDLGEELVVRG